MASQVSFPDQVAQGAEYTLLSGTGLGLKGSGQTGQRQRSWLKRRGRWLESKVCIIYADLKWLIRTFARSASHHSDQVNWRAKFRSKGFWHAIHCKKMRTRFSLISHIHHSFHGGVLVLLAEYPRVANTATLQHADNKLDKEPCGLDKRARAPLVFRIVVKAVRRFTNKYMRHTGSCFERKITDRCTGSLEHTEIFSYVLFYVHTSVKKYNWPSVHAHHARSSWFLSKDTPIMLTSKTPSNILIPLNAAQASEDNEGWHVKVVKMFHILKIASSSQTCDEPPCDDISM